MPLGSFGVEMEWGDNIAPLLQRLVEEGLLRSAEMHRWHCDCRYCVKDFDSAYPLIAQTDSSCAGEIITKPFVSWDAAASVIRAVQDAAFDVDAVPGITAGLHVHVRRPSSSSLEKEALWQWLRWEPTVTRLASGLWPEVRAANSRLRRDIDVSMLDPEGVGVESWTEFEVAQPTPNGLDDLWCQVSELDRHAFVNLSTRHGTHEIRIFNSTRVAWRVEMAVQISRLWFGDEKFVAALACRGPRLENLASAITDAGYEAVADLVARQVEYLPKALYPDAFERVS